MRVRHLDAAPPQAALHIGDAVRPQGSQLHLVATLLRQPRARVKAQVAQAVQQRRLRALALFFLRCTT